MFLSAYRSTFCAAVGTQLLHPARLRTVAEPDCSDALPCLIITTFVPPPTQVWDALSGLEKHSFQHKHIVRTCAFAPTSNKLATGGEPHERAWWRAWWRVRL